MARRPRGEAVLEGIGVAPGIAIGSAWFAPGSPTPFDTTPIAKRRIPAERRRFADAVARTITLYRNLKRRGAALPPAAAEEIGYLLDAYTRMLEGSRLVHGVEALIESRCLSAEAAVECQIADILADFESTGDPYLAARKTDLRDIGARLIDALSGNAAAKPKAPPRGAIVIAAELSPGETALLDPARVRGVLSAAGGPEGHAAIVARALRLPAVMGLAEVMETVRPGDRLVIDGRAGRLVVNPTAATLRRYRALRASVLRKRRVLNRLRRLPAQTRDGARIDLQANMDLLNEVGAIRQSGAAGVGLLRTELLFLGRDSMPGEEEQYQVLRRAVQAMDGAPMTIRTLDAGGDKPVGGMVAGSAPNPALGMRAIRLSLAQPKVFEAQIAAVLRVGRHGPVRMLLPMVTLPEEVRLVRGIVARVARRLRRRGVPVADPLPPLGVMIETPGAALSADSLAMVSDFFAIGTNDLTMYTLAIDRAEEGVAHLYDPLHPAVLRLIQFATDAALRNRLSVSLCGEMAGDARLAGLLVGLGLNSLSMAPAALPAVKRRIRGFDLADARQLAHQVMAQHSATRIKALLQAFNKGA